MPKLKLSLDVQGLNPDLGDEVFIPNPRKDKKYMFLDAWGKYGDGEFRWEDEFKFSPDRQFRSDVAFPLEKLLVEVDGGTWMPHGGRHNEDADREKENLAAILGYRVMHFSPTMISKNPLGCVEQVVRALHCANR